MLRCHACNEFWALPTRDLQLNLGLSQPTELTPNTSTRWVPVDELMDRHSHGVQRGGAVEACATSETAGG